MDTGYRGLHHEGDSHAHSVIGSNAGVLLSLSCGTSMAHGVDEITRAECQSRPRIQVSGGIPRCGSADDPKTPGGAGADGDISLVRDGWSLSVRNDVAGH